MEAGLQYSNGREVGPVGGGAHRPRPADQLPVAASALGATRSTPSWLAQQGRLPLAFIGLGLAWLALATALLLLAPEVAALPHAAPVVVALAHAWVLGFFVTIAMGAMYQLAPVALGTTLANERWAWWHFGLQAAAVPGMVFAFWRADMPLLGHFGGAFGLGTALFAANIWKTVRQSGQRDVVAWSLALAAGWLLLAVFAGLLLSVNRFSAFIPVDPLALLRAHAHLGLAGFFLTLLQGVTFRLVPMFTLGEVRDWRLPRRGLMLSQLGLVGLATALVLRAGYAAAIFGALVLAGMIVSGVALQRTLATRRKRVLDVGILGFVRGLIGLGVAAAAGLVLVWPKTPWGSAPGGLSASVYGLLVIVGGLLPAFVGMLLKIVPFLTWMRAYGPQVGRVPTPSATALSKPRLERWSLNLMTLAIMPLVAGAWSLQTPLLLSGAIILAAGVTVLLVDMAFVLKHLWTPTTGQVVAPKFPARA